MKVKEKTNKNQSKIMRSKDRNFLLDTKKAPDTKHSHAESINFRSFGIKTKMTGVVILTVLILLGWFVYSDHSSLSTFLFGYTITPTPSSTSSKGILQIPLTKNPAKTSGPTFSLDDAKAYIATHLYNKGKTTTGKPSTVESIYFTTDAKVKELPYGQNPGLPPDAPVLVVIEKGPFHFYEGTDPNGNVPIINKILLVYDARTGDLLMLQDYKGN